MLYLVSIFIIIHFIFFSLKLLLYFYEYDIIWIFFSNLFLCFEDGFGFYLYVIVVITTLMGIMIGKDVGFLFTGFLEYHVLAEDTVAYGCVAVLTTKIVEVAGIA